MRKTKIVCTLGPSTDAPGVLKQIMEAGMNVARFNFSHASHEEHLNQLIVGILDNEDVLNNNLQFNINYNFELLISEDEQAYTYFKNNI